MLGAQSVPRSTDTSGETTAPLHGRDSSIHDRLQVKSSPLVIQTHFKFADVSYSRSVNFLLHKAYRCYSRLGSDPVNSKTTVLEKQSQACTFRSRKATVSHARCASTPSC